MDFEDAKQLVEMHMGAGDWKLTPFNAGKFSSVYQAECDGVKYVLRIAPSDDVLQVFYSYRMMRQEPAIHQRVLGQTTVPVAEIIAYDFSRKTMARDYMIMQWLPGRPLNDANLSPAAHARALREWGGYIAQIHTITDKENRFGYLGEHNCMEPKATWAEAFADMYRRELADIVGCGVYDSATADAALSLLEDNLSCFEHCDTSRLMHGDIWITNLLVQSDGQVTGVLDFDRACWGDTEWDLAIAEYCGVTCQPFWEGYGRYVDTHSGDPAVRRMFYLLYEHQKYIVISMSSRRNSPQGARRYAAKCLSVMESFRRTNIPRF